MLDSSQPSYSFHGSNTSHSKDNGSGGRTYHIPNYATSYANEKSNLISVTFDEDKSTSNAIIRVVVLFLLFVAIPLSILAWKPTISHSVNAQAKSQESLGRPMHAFNGNIQVPNKQEATSALEKVYTSAHNNPINERREQDPPHDDRHARDLYWDGPNPNTRCLAFGKREYMARLRNAPFFSNWLEGCKSTEATIHGVVFPHPSFCESKWPFGGAIGHWIVDTGEEECLAYWGRISDKGCIKHKTKLRRFQAQLRGLKKPEDWLALCNTTPVSINGIPVSKPTLCENKAFWGVYASWDLEDDGC